MEKTVISKKLCLIDADIEKLKNTLIAIENSDIELYPENYNMMTLDAALRSELIACRLRHLVYQSTSTEKPKYLATAGIVQGISVSEENGIIKIVLPCLLPKKNKRQSTEFIIDPLYFTLSRYADDHNLKRYKHCVVCFSHIYSENFPRRNIRDYDNLELKQFLDVIATFIMVDDTGLLIDAYNTTEIGKSNCTEISVMSKKCFPDWLKARENSLKTISDL